MQKRVKKSVKKTKLEWDGDDDESVAYVGQFAIHILKDTRTKPCTYTYGASVHIDARTPELQAEPGTMTEAKLAAEAQLRVALRQALQELK